ncbi:DUF1104 domain-containing protein [Campylobacter sp. 7477a]|uniref:DUF1104 domain-containing protein n=1 Tax=Campylobacter sp. 7477a TaxID=2735741 RepID=UPI0030152047|nr:DUF1104 domain-containing protein [Campylobacter sp. 7477a]
MKKLVLAAMLVAGSVFAAPFEKNTNDELYAMIATSDAKTLGEISFEIHKRVGKLHREAMDIRGGFHDKMYEKMSKMKPEDRDKFMRDFRDSFSNKIDALSVKEARGMGLYGMGMGRGNCDMRMGGRWKDGGMRMSGCCDDFARGMGRLRGEILEPK